MKSRIKHVLTRLLALLLSVSVAFAQQNVPAQGSTAFTQEEIDQMVAPIALYPDPLLSQILMAATYPLEVVEAARWARANPGLKGEQAVRAVEQYDWDSSVKSLVAFPQILTMMDEKLGWTERLGEAFLGQQPQIMDTVQSLRQKAVATGNLRSNDQVRVEQQEQTIVVEPANPQVVYVPYYDPTVVYGPWWWPAYPPVYWSPWPDYYFAGGFAWGVGIAVGAEFFFGAFDWPHHHVNVINVNNYYFRHNINAPNHAPNGWRHDSSHRRGVPFRDAALRQQFGHTSTSPDTRRDFRGHSQLPPEERGRLGSRPEERSGPQPATGGFGVRPGAGGTGGRANMPDIRLPDTRSTPSLPTVRSVASPPPAEQRPPVFEGVGRGAEVRSFSERGRASYQRMAPGSSTPAPASRPPGNVSAPQSPGRFSGPRPSEHARDRGGKTRP